MYSYAFVAWCIATQEELYPGFESAFGAFFILFFFYVIALINYVCQGNRPPLPAVIPDFLQHLIVECWAQDPNLRPDFSVVVDRLNECAASSVVQTIN